MEGRTGKRRKGGRKEKGEKEKRKSISNYNAKNSQLP